MRLGDRREQHPARDRDAGDDERIGERGAHDREPGRLVEPPEHAEDADADDVLQHPDPGCSLVGAQQHGILAPAGLRADEPADDDEPPADAHMVVVVSVEAMCGMTVARSASSRLLIAAGALPLFASSPGGGAVEML